MGPGTVALVLAGLFRRDILEEIEKMAEGPAADLPRALRRCITLGGLTGTSELREWASLELKGYHGDVELPAYRELNATLFGDTTSGVRHQVVPIQLIPAGVRDAVESAASFSGPLAELIEIAERARRRDEPIRHAPDRMPELLALINNEVAQQNPGAPTRFERVYFQTDPSAVWRIVDLVRTTLVELVAEMRAARPGPRLLPTGDAAERAAQVAVRGIGHRVTVQQAVGDGTSVSSVVKAEGSSRIGVWFTVLGALAAVATVVLMVILR